MEKVLWKFEHKPINDKEYRIELVQDGCDLMWLVTRTKPHGRTRSFTIQQVEGPDEIMSQLYYWVAYIESHVPGGFDAPPVEKFTGTSDNA